MYNSWCARTSPVDRVLHVYNVRTAAQGTWQTTMIQICQNSPTNRWCSKTVMRTHSIRYKNQTKRGGSREEKMLKGKWLKVVHRLIYEEKEAQEGVLRDLFFKLHKCLNLWESAKYFLSSQNSVSCWKRKMAEKINKQQKPETERVAENWKIAIPKVQHNNSNGPIHVSLSNCYSTTQMVLYMSVCLTAWNTMSEVNSDPPPTTTPTFPFWLWLKY